MLRRNINVEVRWTGWQSTAPSRRRVHMKWDSETLRAAACITALREERGDASRSSSDNGTGQVGLDVVTKKIIHVLVGNRFKPPF